jgi:hypothetical protein
MRISCEPVAIQQGREYGSKGIFIVRSRYDEKTNKDIEDVIYAVVTLIFKVCKSVKLLPLPVVTSCKNSINPITNPNPMSSNYHTTMCCPVLPDIIDSGEKTGIQNCAILVVMVGTFCAAYVLLCFCNPIHYYCNHSFVLLYSESKELCTDLKCSVLADCLPMVCLYCREVTPVCLGFRSDVRMLRSSLTVTDTNSSANKTFRAFQSPSLC